MFTFTVSALLRDGAVFFGCALFVFFCSLLYLWYRYWVTCKKVGTASFKDVARSEWGKPFFQLGVLAFFLFMVTYGCKIVLLRIIFVLCYVYVIYRIFTKSSSK